MKPAPSPRKIYRHRRNILISIPSIYSSKYRLALPSFIFHISGIRVCNLSLLKMNVIRLPLLKILFVRLTYIGACTCKLFIFISVHVLLCKYTTFTYPFTFYPFDYHWRFLVWSYYSLLVNTDILFC